ncbi:hypothetical protein [Streptosporangium sp. NPDC000396]
MRAYPRMLRSQPGPTGGRPSAERNPPAEESAGYGNARHVVGLVDMLLS